MGSPEGEPGRSEYEGELHEVEITPGFWLFDTPVTQALWEAVMRGNPSRFKDPQRPVENVSFDDVQTFLVEANGKAWGKYLGLPTEAQWEYACRAGTETATYAGPIDILSDGSAPALEAIAWYGFNSGVDLDLEDGYAARTWPQSQYAPERAATRKVGQKAANPWGLYDMLGNVWEWCEDEYFPGYERAPTDSSARGSRNAMIRVIRGGGWHDDARLVRAASRAAMALEDRFDVLGFRCTLVEGRPQTEAAGPRCLDRPTASDWEKRFNSRAQN
jgi:formylglycine-generating enzyme required for sulfatase activity